jgi:hypothetical protein
LSVAARFLNNPKRQDLLFSLQNKLNQWQYKNFLMNLMYCTTI